MQGWNGRPQTGWNEEDGEEKRGRVLTSLFIRIYGRVKNGKREEGGGEEKSELLGSKGSEDLRSSAPNAPRSLTANRSGERGASTPPLGRFVTIRHYVINPSSRHGTGGKGPREGRLSAARAGLILGEHASLFPDWTYVDVVGVDVVGAGVGEQRVELDPVAVV